MADDAETLATPGRLHVLSGGAMRSTPFTAQSGRGGGTAWLLGAASCCGRGAQTNSAQSVSLQSFRKPPRRRSAPPLMLTCISGASAAHRNRSSFRLRHPEFDRRSHPELGETTPDVVEGAPVILSNTPQVWSKPPRSRSRPPQRWSKPHHAWSEHAPTLVEPPRSQLAWLNLCLLLAWVWRLGVGALRRNGLVVN